MTVACKPAASARAAACADHASAICWRASAARVSAAAASASRAKPRRFISRELAAARYSRSTATYSGSSGVIVARRSLRACAVAVLVS